MGVEKGGLEVRGGEVSCQGLERVTTVIPAVNWFGPMSERA